MAFFGWLEMLPFSLWIRESGSLWAFPMFLFAHTLGMSIVAGGSTFISFALLGLWPKGGAIKPLERLYPIMWWGFGINLFTGRRSLLRRRDHARGQSRLLGEAGVRGGGRLR